MSEPGASPAGWRCLANLASAASPAACSGALQVFSALGRARAEVWAGAWTQPTAGQAGAYRATLVVTAQLLDSRDAPLCAAATHAEVSLLLCAAEALLQAGTADSCVGSCLLLLLSSPPPASAQLLSAASLLLVRLQATRDTWQLRALARVLLDRAH